ncbi:MAG: DUF2309 domain-containing protein [Bacteroidia bacterium]|nr:DUF2309 domain-containing protein [Bacteroidia bacterium]
MIADASVFHEHEVLHELKHYLPAQAPLKDFIHHNSLHAFQHMPFFDAVRTAAKWFGYKSTLSLEEYRSLYAQGRIPKEVLMRSIRAHTGEADADAWYEKAVHWNYEDPKPGRIGGLRAAWKQHYQTDLDSLVHPLLFRTLCSYLDQGVSIWDFPLRDQPFLAVLRELERDSVVSLFRSRQARELLLSGHCAIGSLLERLVGDPALFRQYLFDQQFAHQGWSGMVAMIESQPGSLLDPRQISLHDLIVFELLLELDALFDRFGLFWPPLAQRLTAPPPALFAEVPESEKDRLIRIWQEALEWSYFDQMLGGMYLDNPAKREIKYKSFQALCCIDDRYCSFRRYLEKFDPDCETFGTPGFFGVDAYYQPNEGKFFTKICPAPVKPRYLIKEYGVLNTRRESDVHFSKHTHSIHSGWLISQTLGFWSALRLFLQIFMPSMSPATASSLKHMYKEGRLTVENQHARDLESGLQIGYTVAEMAERVDMVLKSIGLVKSFAPLVYVFGHGSSSVNNPHYAAYDCGACSGRAGSVNARAFATMANHPRVRALLRTQGIEIPDSTWFIGALHDTTRDELVFFDEELLTPAQHERHERNLVVFQKMLMYNAKERARRFPSINIRKRLETVHRRVMRRSVSLFEPRPELNHARNCMCIVGRREISKALFMDRRSFLNSYDYRIDPEGRYLEGILNAAAPVCGGINLEYYFSRVDNQKLGAGSKLPHNVMGLFGVANGIDGDLRPGLPSQMIEVHDPLRLLMVVEHYPEVVLDTIRRTPSTCEWFANQWVLLVVLHPEERTLFRFDGEGFQPYVPLTRELPLIGDLNTLIESDESHFPVYRIA